MKSALYNSFPLIPCACLLNSVHNSSEALKESLEQQNVYGKYMPTVAMPRIAT